MSLFTDLPQSLVSIHPRSHHKTEGMQKAFFGTNARAKSAC